MTNKIHNFTESLFDSMMKENNEIAKKYLEKMRTHPEQVEPKDFVDHPDLIEAGEIYKFFKENSLGAEAPKRYLHFQNWLNEIQ